MSVEQERPLNNQPSEVGLKDKPSVAIDAEPISSQTSFESDPNQEVEEETLPSPKLPVGRITLETDLLKETALPLTIEVSGKLVERARGFLEERGRTIKIVGSVAVVGAAAAATGIAVKRYLKKRKEKPIPLTRQQDEEFTSMYERCFTRVCSYIYFRVGNDQDTEDLAQRVFERALKAFPDFQPIPDLKNPYLPWLYRIAHNQVANFLRDKSRRPPNLALLEDIATASIEELIKEPSEKRARLMKVVRSLDDESQFIIWLKLEGLSNEEIGQILEKSEGAVKSQYFRIWKEIRERVEQSEQEALSAG